VDPSHRPTDQRVKITRPGAIPGARSHSQPRTTTDAHGAQTAVLDVNADPGSVRTLGRDLRIIRSDREKRGLPASCPSRTDSACDSKVIMTGEAVARPQKLQKLRQAVHSLGKSHGDGKVLTTRQNGVLCLPVMILERAPGRIPKPCVVGSNPTGGADASGLRVSLARAAWQGTI
jgi:hypothetical protein